MWMQFKSFTELFVSYCCQNIKNVLKVAHFQEDIMFGLLNDIIPYISGLWTLPWIAVGFFVTLALSRIYGEERINRLMKKIGLVLLFVFIPILVFRLFLNIDFREEEIDFVILSCIFITLLYGLAYVFALRNSKKISLTGEKRIDFIKTVVVNQGRSAAFFGSAILSIEKLEIFAAIYLTLLGIFLFAAVPYVLSVMHKKDIEGGNKQKNPLPPYLRIYPWYLLIFPISAVFIHGHAGITTASNDYGILLKFLGAVTIPAALYYVGSGIKIRDIKTTELKKLFFGKSSDEMGWVKHILLLTMVITPIVVTISCVILSISGIIPTTWAAVLIINSILPITSTNMFLIPYGIDKRVTALSVTWSTFFSIPIFVVLLYVFTVLFG